MIPILPYTYKLPVIIITIKYYSESRYMIRYTDTHCHLDFDRFDEDRSQVIERAIKNGLVWILNPGIDIPTNQAAIELAQAHPQIINAAVGVHPNYGKPWTKNIYETLEMQAQNKHVVAIGEIGLDYYRDHTPQPQQKRMLIDQLNLAEKYQLPVIIHNRDATHDLIPILEDWHNQLKISGNPIAEHPGVLHSFDADFTTAQKVVEMGFFIGISGPITYKNGLELRSIVKNMEISCLLTETDAPFLTPHPHRGKRNEPSHIPLIVEEIAKLHNRSPKEIAEICYTNAKKLFTFKTEQVL
jgi:TatD DNase family protein